MEKKALSTLLTLITLLSTFHLSTSSSVLDIQGNPVRTDSAYTIHVLLRIIGGLKPLPLNGSLYAGFSSREVDPGVPVVFHPYQPGNTLQVGMGYRFTVQFQSTSCGGEWEVADGGDYVLADGGKDGPSYFCVMPREEGEEEYTLGFCGSCPVCKNVCVPVGKVSGGFLNIGASSGELKVRFVKAGYAHESGMARAA